MKTFSWRILFIAALLMGWTMGSLMAEDLAAIQLLKPQMDGGKPLMQALKLRATSRAFALDPLPLQTLSDLLWAAWGINRPDSKKRTAPSAMNWQETDLYAVMEKGVYLYDAAAHILKPVVAGDMRGLTGRQDFVKTAPLTLVFVSDLARTGKGPADQKTGFVWADAAFICQNIYLFCYPNPDHQPLYRSPGQI